MIALERRIHRFLLTALLCAASAARAGEPTVCGGDCDASGAVTIDELVLIGAIVREEAPSTSCLAADTNTSGSVTQDELDAARENALGPCAPAPSPPDPGQQPISINVGFAVAQAGAIARLPVSLTAAQGTVAGIQNYIGFGPQLSVVADAGGTPECAVNPKIEATGSFAFSPVGCDPAADCERVLAFVETLESQGLFAEIYTCMVRVEAGTTPATYPISVLAPLASSAAGDPLPAMVVNGGILVRPPATATPTFTTTPTTTPTPTVTPTATRTPTATATPSATSTPSGTATPTVEVTDTPTSTRTPSATNSPTRSPTATQTPSATASPTVTPTSAISPSATPTATPTPTSPPCIADCDASGAATVDDAIRAVRVALGLLGVDACEPADTDTDGRLTIDELVRVVAALLEDCPA